MSEQPPRASSQVPFAGAAPQHGFDPDPEAPPASSSGAPRPSASTRVPVDAEERLRTRTSEGLDKAADAARRLGHHARDQGGIASHAEPIAYRVGDSLQSAASYVRAHDVGDMRDDVEMNVRRSPIKALAIAALGGFLLGKMIR